MKSSIDLGVTSFDTAEIYADTLCESQIGEAFAKDPALRGKVRADFKNRKFTNKKLMENHLGIIIQLMIESYDPVKKVFRDYIQIILTYI